jgi:hypothetical protein
MRLCEADLIIRTWAVWRRARILGYVLFVCFCAVTIVGIVFVAKFQNSSKSPCFSQFLPWTTNSRFAVIPRSVSGSTGCYVFSGSSAMSLDMMIPFLMLIVFDTGTTSLSGLDR